MRPDGTTPVAGPLSLVVIFQNMIEFNSNTGTIKLNDGFEINQNLSRSKFIHSAQGKISQAIIKNNPWYSYSLLASDEGIVFILSFKSELLTNINISMCSKEFGSNWSDWSEEKEKSRKVANEQWLKNNNIEPDRKYPWGKASSFHDRKSGDSTILVEFN
jgi:hypothetical protein